jgi:hypothetical protein
VLGVSRRQDKGDMTQHTARFCHAYSQENVKRHKSMASPVIGRHITVYVFWQIKGEASWVLTTPKSPGPHVSCNWSTHCRADTQSPGGHTEEQDARKGTF